MSPQLLPLNKQFQRDVLPLPTPQVSHLRNQFQSRDDGFQRDVLSLPTPQVSRLRNQFPSPHDGNHENFPEVTIIYRIPKNEIAQQALFGFVFHIQTMKFYKIQFQRDVLPRPTPQVSRLRNQFERPDDGFQRDVLPRPTLQFSRLRNQFERPHDGFQRDVLPLPTPQVSRLRNQFERPDDGFQRDVSPRPTLQFSRLRNQFERPHDGFQRDVSPRPTLQFSRLRNQFERPHDGFQRDVLPLPTPQVSRLRNQFERPHDGVRRGRYLERNTSQKKLLPSKHIGMWIFGGNDYFTSVPSHWSVSRCTEEMKTRLNHTGDLDMWAMNRCILLDKRKMLSNYIGLTKLYVVRRPNYRSPHPVYITTKADVTDPYGDEDCVKMPCGHGISPENLFRYSWHKITSGNTTIRCPALLDEKKPSVHCGKVWDFKYVSRLARLSSDERGLFLSVLFINWLEKNKNAFLCPKCDEAVISSCIVNGYFECYFCQKRGGACTYCTRCLRPISPFYGCSNAECKRSIPQTRSLLHNCPERTIVGVAGCPTVRACPGCQCIIQFENTDKCKLMDCPNRTCRTRFCFICLNVPSREGFWPCDGAFSKCKPAPRQYVP